MTDVATERHDAARSAAETTDAAASRLNREMMQRDLASAMLGMVVELDEPGHAVVSMRVREDMTNGFAITHGGLVFTLADTAFAIACNEDHRVTVAAGADITFLKSTVAGQTLTATAVRRARSGRTGHALRQYLECRRALVETLGIEPAEATSRLQARILAGQPV